MKKITAVQLSSMGVPLKHLGTVEYSESRWNKLMKFYKDRGVKPRWKRVATKKTENG